MVNNAALRFLKVSMKIGINSVSFVGLVDSPDNDNYYAPGMINNARLEEETNRRSDIMAKMLEKILIPIHNYIAL